MSGEWIGIREARGRPGLRLVLLRGLPSPWSLAARAIFELERVAFTKVQRTPEDPPDALREWTGQDSFPVAVCEDERPRSGWAEILYWATFANAISPLGNDKLPLSDRVRRGFTASDAATLGALEPALLAHRVAIYEPYLSLPVEL